MLNYQKANTLDCFVQRCVSIDISVFIEHCYDHVMRVTTLLLLFMKNQLLVIYSTKESYNWLFGLNVYHAAKGV